LEIHDHIVYGEKSGHLELVFVCSERAPIVFVTGTCRFADHARFGRFNIKIGDNRRLKFGATAIDGGNALGPTDAKDAIRIVNAITNAEKVTIQIQPFPWLPTNATFYPTKDGAQVDEIRAACFGVSVSNANHAEKSSLARIVSCNALDSQAIHHYTSAILYGPRFV